LEFLFLPGFLLNDMNTPLKDRGLDEYEKGHDRLHNTKGHMAKLFDLFQNESNFNKPLAFEKLLKIVHRHSFKESMKGSDWRYYFVRYKETLLPCISHKKRRSRINSYYLVRNSIYLLSKYKKEI